MTQNSSGIGYTLTLVSALAIFFYAGDVFTAGFAERGVNKNERIIGQIVYILDGDSFVAEIGGREQQVRLWGIDCPEHDQEGGDDAKEFLSTLVKEKTVFLIPKDIDRYGRLVAIAENCAGILNEKLVSSGHAWVYSYYCRESVCSKWKYLQAVAKDKRVGLWRNSHPTAPWMWKKKK